MKRSLLCSLAAVLLIGATFAAQQPQTARATLEGSVTAAIL